MPADQQRFFTLKAYDSWEQWFTDFFVYPIALYLVWVIFYGIVTFVITDKVREYKIDSVYKTFTTNPSLNKKFAPILKFVPTPIVFLTSHFLVFLSMHFIGVLVWHSFVLHLLMEVFLLEYAVYQGANYYMDYFSKQYEKQLANLAMLEESVVTPTLTRSQSNQSNLARKLSSASANDDKQNPASNEDQKKKQ